MIFVRAGDFILSERFIRNSPNGTKFFKELIILYELKSTILKFKDTYTSACMKEMHEDLHCLEEAIQEAFGYKPDRNYHRFWEWPYCKCPVLDNMDHWGTSIHYYSGSCPVHGDKITQDNWKGHFFSAVKEYT